MGNDSANQNRTKRQIQQQRRGDNALSGARPIAYADEAGVDRNLSGDEQAPHLKVPPFPTDVTRWERYEPIPASVDAWFFTAPVDVSKRRILTVWIEYNSTPNNDAPLLIIPQALYRSGAQSNDPDDFFNIAVVNPLLTIVTGVGAPFLATEDFGQRDVYPTQLRVPVSIGGPGVVTTSKFVLPVDVSMYDQFRLGLSVESGGTLILHYSFAE